MKRCITDFLWSDFKGMACEREACYTEGRIPCSPLVKKILIIASSESSDSFENVFRPCYIWLILPFLTRIRGLKKACKVRFGWLLLLKPISREGHTKRGLMKSVKIFLHKTSKIFCLSARQERYCSHKKDRKHISCFNTKRKDSICYTTRQGSNYSK